MVAALEVQLRLAPVHIACLRGNKRCFEYLLLQNPRVLGRLLSPADVDLDGFVDAVVELSDALPVPSQGSMKRSLLAGDRSLSYECDVCVGLTLLVAGRFAVRLLDSTARGNKAGVIQSLSLGANAGYQNDRGQTGTYNAPLRCCHSSAWS